MMVACLENKMHHIFLSLTVDIHKCKCDILAFPLYDREDAMKSTMRINFLWNRYDILQGEESEYFLGWHCFVVTTLFIDSNN